MSDIRPTKAVQKAINTYGLKQIHTGSLSNVPNDRYLRSSRTCFDVGHLDKDLKLKHFIIVFNHAETKFSCWTVYETPYMNFEKAKEIYMKEHGRRLWDSSRLYYDNGNEIIAIII